MKYILLVIFSFLLSVGQAQPDLEYFITAALENNPTLKDSDNQIKISALEQQRLEKELTGLKVNLTADYLLAPYFNNSKFIDTNPDANAIGYDAGITNGGLYSALINARQPLFSGQILNAYDKEQTATQKAQTYRKALTANALTKDITDQYISVYRDQRLIKMNEQLLAVIQDQAVIIKRLVEAALLKQSDALLINLEEKSQQIIITNLENQKSQDLLDLYTLSGMQDTTNVTVTEPYVTVDDNQQAESVFLNPYRADSLSVVANNATFNTNYQPQVSVYGDAGLNAVQVNDIQQKLGFSLGLSLTFPVYDGNQRMINEQKSKIAQSTIKNYKEAKDKEVENNIIKFRKSIRNLEQNISALKEQKNGYELLFQKFKQEIKTGQLSVIDYINSLKVYRQLQLNLINLQSDLLMKKNALNYWKG